MKNLINLMNSQTLDQAVQTGKRSTVLNPIQWMMAILLSGLTSSVLVGAHPAITVVLIVLIVIAFILFGWAYVYFGINNSDNLRSEEFSLTKLAIQARRLGDSQTGIVSQVIDATDALPAGTYSEDEGSFE